MHAAVETLTDIATFFGFASLKSTALIALVLIAQKAFSRYLSADGRYLLWLAVVISLVTPVGCNAPTRCLRRLRRTASPASRTLQQSLHMPT